MDDIVTVLAEEHGCLDTIKVDLASLVVMAVLEYFPVNITGFMGGFIEEQIIFTF